MLTQRTERHVKVARKSEVRYEAIKQTIHVEFVQCKIIPKITVQVTYMNMILIKFPSSLQHTKQH